MLFLTPPPAPTLPQCSRDATAAIATRLPLPRALTRLHTEKVRRQELHHGVDLPLDLKVGPEVLEDAEVVALLGVQDEELDLPMRVGCGVWGVGCGVWGVGCGRGLGLNRPNHQQTSRTVPVGQREMPHPAPS